MPAEEEQDASALEGVRVLRLGSSPAGDFLSRILADAGASVESFVAARSMEFVHHDVIVNDLGRGSAPPDGLDFDTMAGRNPDLVYCSLVSFPQGGPQGLPELEDDAIMAVMGLNRLSGEEPDREQLRIPSFYGAQMAAIYIACGLMKRNRLGRALYIEVPLFSIALNVLGRKLIRFDDPGLRDPQDVNYMLPVASIRKCADGRYVQPQGRYPNLVRILFRAAGHPEWADDAAEGLEYLPDRETYDMWDRRMDEMFLARPAAEWERVINDAGGACTLCRSHAEWVVEAQPHASGIFRSAEGGGLEVGPGFIIHEGSQIGDPPVGPPALANATRPLAGIRVLDFTIIIAGPAMGRILADLGAEVIKVDAPDRVVNPVLWMDVNRGKRSLILDLRNENARDIARELARGSDVVIENFRRGKLDAIGLGYSDVARSNPGVVYTSANLFDQTGPWAERPGWDHNAQAATGIHVARSRNGIPRHMPLPVNDYGTGLFGALGTVLGLLHRERKGRGARVAVSLARTASFLQQMHLVDRNAVRPPAVACRTVACADGWVTAYLRPGETLDEDVLRSAKDLPVSAVRERLTGFGAAIESTPSDLVRSRLLDETGLRVRWAHPEFGPMAEVVPAGTMSGHTLSPLRCAPSPGAHNAEILAEIGKGEMLSEYEDAGAVGRFPLFGQRRWARDTA